jgi:mRNA interferase MazF
MDICSRGDLVTIALQGDYGKPRPAVVVQSDYFADLGTVVVLPVTSTLVDAPLLRLTLEPSELNNLRQRSQVMMDKPVTVKRDKLGAVFGSLTPEELLRINRSLMVLLGIAA